MRTPKLDAHAHAHFILFCTSAFHYCRLMRTSYFGGWVLVNPNCTKVSTRTCNRMYIGSDTTIPKFGLNIFREILEKSSKYLQKFFKYLKISWKFRILIRWRTLVSKPQRRQRLSRHSIWWMQYHANALAGKKLIIHAKSVTHWWLIFKKKVTLFHAEIFWLATGRWLKPIRSCKNSRKHYKYFVVFKSPVPPGSILVAECLSQGPRKIVKRLSLACMPPPLPLPSPLPIPTKNVWWPNQFN